MSGKLPPFSEREVTVTIRGEEWFAILAHLTYAKAPKGLFSTAGARIFKNGTKRLGEQLIAASGDERPKLEIVR
jgi:hypothetical protein